MKDIRMVLPNIASDTAGAASILFETGGLTVIHDAAGSHEVFITFEEARSLEGCRTVASRLSKFEAVTGDDGILLDRIERACEIDPPPFIAIVGSPVPFTIGTDLDGMAAEAQYSTGIPAFAVTAGGFGLYDQGAGEALEKLVATLTRDPVLTDGLRVNLLGASPFDCSAAELDGMKKALLDAGAQEGCALTMGETLDSVRSAADAARNIVISAAGLNAARYMHRRWGIPCSIGIPTKDTAAALLAGEAMPVEKTHRRVLVLGDAVFAGQLAGTLGGKAGTVTTDGGQIFPEVPTVKLDTEESIRREVRSGYDVIVGDPLYRQFLPCDSPCTYFERPHKAQSSRLYAPCGETIDQLIENVKGSLK